MDNRKQFFQAVFDYGIELLGEDDEAIKIKYYSSNLHSADITAIREDEERTYHRINYTHIGKAIEKILNPEYQIDVDEDNFKSIAWAYYNYDDSLLESESVNIIFQIILYGEILYPV